MKNSSAGQMIELGQKIARTRPPEFQFSNAQHGQMPKREILKKIMNDSRECLFVFRLFRLYLSVDSNTASESEARVMKS